MTTAQRRELATVALTEHGLSERRACRLLGISRTAFRYETRRPDDETLIAGLLELAERWPRWGVPDGRPAASGRAWVEPQAHSTRLLRVVASSAGATEEKPTQPLATAVGCAGVESYLLAGQFLT